jgi:ribosome assembly protein YihI (activator of Der GTPase)
MAKKRPGDPVRIGNRLSFPLAVAQKYKRDLNKERVARKKQAATLRAQFEITREAIEAALDDLEAALKRLSVVAALPPPKFDNMGRP